MNPLKWSLWIRLAVVASILWMVGGFFGWFGAGGRLTHDDRMNLLLIFPLVLLWGTAWIVHGISDSKIRGTIIRVLVIGLVVIIGIIIIIVGAEIYVSFFASPTPHAPHISGRDLLAP